MTTTILAYIPSPSQGVWHVLGVPLRAYALFIIIGIVAALVLGDRRWVARGGEPGVVYDVAMWAVPFGLIGGRLYHVITDWRTYFGDDGAGLGAALRIWDGGLGIWGAVALGGVGAWIACRRRGIPLPAFGDAIAPGIILAQAIGRLGNYFNQELFGRPTDLPWGLEIYQRVNAAGYSDTLNGVSTGELIKVVHPTFLYELLWNLLVFAVLILIDRRYKIGHGRLFAIYVAGYCVGRFWIELMRSDTATLLAGIRVNSFTSTFVFIGAVVYIMVAPKDRDDPATLKGNQEDAEADEDSEVEDFVKGLAVGASTTGVVAAATVAGADDAADTKAGGLGSVEGDEAVEAAEGAPAVHDAAVEGEADAGALAAALEAEVAQSEGTGEHDEVSVVDPAEAVEAGPPLETEAGGIGSVEGDEVAEAAEGASVAHDAAVEGEADAEALVADVETEESDADAAVPVAESESETETEGFGAVEGDELAEAVEVAPEAHDAAVEGEADAEALVADVEAEESDAEPESATETEGLGSVEGDEAAEDASAAHQVAVEGEADAEALSAEVQDPEFEDSADEVPAAAEGAAVVEALEAETEDESADEGESEAEPAEPADDEPDAQPIAAEGAAVVEALDAEIETESGGSVSDEASDDADGDDADGEDDDADGEPEGTVTDPPAYRVEYSTGGSVSQSGGGVRGWLRRRRNR